MSIKRKWGFANANAQSADFADHTFLTPIPAYDSFLRDCPIKIDFFPGRYIDGFTGQTHRSLTSEKNCYVFYIFWPSHLRSSLRGVMKL